MASEFIVNLNRDSLHTPWGFRMQGGRDHDAPLIVSRVVALGAAEGILQPGDRILKIDQIQTDHLTHEEATHLISSSGGQLRLRILRGAHNNVYTVPAGAQPRSVASMQPRSNSAEPKMRTEEEEEYKLPTNSQLAGLMNQSLTLQDQGRTKPQRQPYFRHFYMPRSGSAQNEDITAYLPKPGKIRQQSAHKESQLRSQMRDSLLRSTSPGGSGRSTPNSAVLELASPGDPGAHVAVGVWTPPAHQPNARLVHAQYNSPMHLYTPHNVADMVKKQTGQKLKWENKPRVRFLDDIKDSPTYKYVQEMQGEEPESSHDYEQSRTIKNLNRYFRNQVGLDL